MTPTSPSSAAPASVYVHFPWCLAKCPYCDFVSFAAERPDIDHHGYAEAVLRELRARAAAFASPRRRVESVFFGGGTPSLWDPAALGRVLEGIRSFCDVSAGAEVTVECNPSSLDADRAKALADVGVNRLSIGVQSLRDDRLKFLGRLHDARGALQAVSAAMGSGIPRVSADLIFGLPDQTPEQARREASELADTGLRHLSCYQLTIESGTRFGELARRGRLPLADEAMVADSFASIEAELGARGLLHYEISNYAAPGHEARHNLGYWHGQEYLGLGCGAYGFARVAPEAGHLGVRWLNVSLPDRYIRASNDVAAGVPAPADGLSQKVEALDAETLLRERIMLGLRLAEGLDVDAAGLALGTAGWTPARSRAAEVLETRGRLVRDRGVARIPASAWIWADDTVARLF